MSEHTPLTEAERDDFRRHLRQNLGYRAWVIEDTMLGHVERILAARTSTATADTGLREACRLEPAENMALTVAWHQVERGEEPMSNVASVCVVALERIRRAALDATAAPTTDTGARDE